MELSKDEQIKNLETEYVKLLMLLKDKFPEAYQYYIDRLKPIYKGKEI